MKIFKLVNLLLLGLLWNFMECIKCQIRFRTQDQPVLFQNQQYQNQLRYGQRSHTFQPTSTWSQAHNTEKRSLEIIYPNEWKQETQSNPIFRTENFVHNAKFISDLNTAENRNQQARTYVTNSDFRDSETGWRIPEKGEHQSESRFLNLRRYSDSGAIDPQTGRFISETAFSRISETLGAINKVGHYLVDMINEESDEENKPNDNIKEIPNALYTISKNVLGRNVTDKIAPLVRRALPKVLPDSPLSKITNANEDSNENDDKICETPDGGRGICDELRLCPQLLLDIDRLRESICFTNSFIPGVCCPLEEKPSTSKPTYLLPVTTTAKPTTTKSPHILVLTTSKPKTSTVTSTTHKLTTTTKPTAAQITTARPTNRPSLVGNYSNIVNMEECGQREDESGRIVGGTESKPGAWPWMVAIYLHGAKRKEFWCGGSLIASKHVLTAAHCTKDSKQREFPPRQFLVRLGDIDLASDSEPSRPITMRVVEVRVHEKFLRVGYYNDIAILVLAESVQKSKYVIPICLPSAEDARELYIGSRATVVGWGTTRYGGTESTKQLEAILPVWRNSECDRAYFQPITDNFICAGVLQGGTDACQGDSGGPLMLQIRGRWTQIGIVSFGNKCGEPGYPGVYTRLTHYDQWIRDHIN